MERKTKAEPGTACGSTFDEMYALIQQFQRLQFENQYTGLALALIHTRGVLLEYSDVRHAVPFV